MTQIRASQIRASQIRATEISSNHRELHGAIFLLWKLNKCSVPSFSRVTRHHMEPEPSPAAHRHKREFNKQRLRLCFQNKHLSLTFIQSDREKRRVRNNRGLIYGWCAGSHLARRYPPPRRVTPQHLICQISSNKITNTL